MKESKNTLTPEMLGALSQAKQIHAQLSKSGIPVDAVNSETVKENQLLFEYLTAIHSAIVKKELPASGSRPSSSPSPSPSSSSTLPASDSALEEVIRKAVIESQKERENYIIKNGGFSYEQLYEMFLNTLESNKEALTTATSNYHKVFTQYSKFIEERRKAEQSKYDNDQTLSKSVDSLTQTLSPLLEANTVTFRTLFRKRMAQWKQWPRWKNPTSYIYILVGLMYMALSLYLGISNHHLRKNNEIAKGIINEYIIVDMAMSDNEDYPKERTQIHESIQENGFYVTWDEVCRLRTDNP